MAPRMGTVRDAVIGFLRQAGLTTIPIAMEDIGWDSMSKRFVDEQLGFMRTVFKLYPWEWLATDDFGGHVIDSADLGSGAGGTCWIEPPWRMLLSNKALLAVLWELNPGHPNLLPARLDGPATWPAMSPNRCWAARGRAC